MMMMMMMMMMLMLMMMMMMVVMMMMLLMMLMMMMLMMLMLMMMMMMLMMMMTAGRVCGHAGASAHWLKSKGVAALIFFLASFSMSTRLFFISDTLPFKISGNSE